MRERGLLKWAPYKSLEQQTDYLARMEYERNKIPCPQISSDKAEEINEIVSNYHNETVVAKYWHDGYIYTIHGKITEISSIYKYLKVEDVEISFTRLTNLSYEH